MGLKFGQVKRWFLIGWLLVCMANTQAQEAGRVPEFIKQFEEAKNDSLRSYALGWACYHSAYSNPEQGIKYGRQALAMGQRSKDERQVANFYNNMGLCFDAWGKADSAEFYYRKSIQILEKLSLKCEAANALANIGNLQRKGNRVSEALMTYSIASAVQERCEDKTYYCATLQAIGACYNTIKDFKTSITYFKKALDFATLYNDSAAICNAHHGSANAYLGLEKLDSARQEYFHSLNCYKQTGNTYLVGFAYEGLSQLAAHQNEIDSAVAYCNEAQKIYQGIGSLPDVIYIKQLTAEHLIKGKRYAAARKTLMEAKAMVRADDYQQEQVIAAYLSQAEAGLGNYKPAYEYLLRSEFLIDSLKVDNEKDQIEKLAGKYETEKRDRQIELEQAQKQTLQAEHDKQKQQKYFLLGGMILLALLALVLINRYRQKQRTARELEEKNIIIEQEKERAERSERVKQQFLANMSHEIRTPVNAINGLSRLLLEKEHDNQTAEYLRAINHSGENLLVILNDILDLSKLEADKMTTAVEPFNLRIEVLSVIQVFAQRAREKVLSLENNIDPSIPETVMGDAGRLTQVLTNLISNAIKFTDRGGVSVDVQKVDSSNISFTVKDTGRGIPIEKQKEVFENFVQADNHHAREHGGTGLGLAIAKRLVEVMGGSIQLRSIVDEGSSFSFILPLLADSEVKSKANVPIAVTEKELHFVVAEDNEYNFWVTEGTLKKYFPKTTVYRALNGEEVLRLCEEDVYDLILMDVQMPLLDGIEATKRIRRSDTATPILGLTASVVQEEIERCLQVGMNDYIMKPFDVSVFVSKIRSVLAIDEKALMFAEDAAEMNQREALFLKLIPDKLAVFKTAADENNLAIMQRTIHSMRPQLLHNGLQRFDDDFVTFENAKTWNDDLEVKLHTILAAIEDKLKEYRNNAHS